MISLATLAIILSGLGILVTGLLAVTFLKDPVKGMAQVTHRLEFLPQVMAGRYSGFVLLALGATLYQDLTVIAFLFAVFAFYSVYDAVIYTKAGHPYAKHLSAGVASGIVTLVAGAALVNERGGL